jgi:oligosaccharide repeat unit polymerase
MILRLRILSPNNVFLISWGIIFILLLAPILFFTFGLSYEEAVYPLCVGMVIVILWILCTLKYISRDLFNFYSLFVLSAVLFNGGQALLEVLHLNERGILNGRFSSETIAQTLYLVVLSLMSFHIGGILGVRMKGHVSGDTNKRKYPPATTSQALRMVGYVLLIIAVVPALKMTIDALKVVVSGGYFALYQREIRAGMASGYGGVVRALSHFYSTGLLFLLAGSNDRPTVRRLASLAVFVHVSTLMFQGIRGYGTMLLIAGLWVRHRVVRPASLRKIFIGGSILLFVIFPTVKLIRNVAGESRLNLQFIADAFFSIENPTVVILQEMGGSMGTIAHTLQLIPSERPFALGSTYAYAATTIIPNLFWDLHPAIKYGNLAHWLTMTVDPEFFSIGGGLGYSFIAEAYANFGWLGTPLVMGLIGFIIARITAWSAGREDYGRIAVVAGGMAIVLFWPRADVTIFTRWLAYYVFPAYFLFFYFRRGLDRRKRIKHENPFCP